MDSFLTNALAVSVEGGSDGFLLLQISWLGIRNSWIGVLFGVRSGYVRFPDFYTRMHAAGKGDTLSTMLMLCGFGLVTMDDFSIGSWLVLFKILAVVLFIYLTTPTSSHALMRAAFEDDEMPMTEEDLKKANRKDKKKK